MCCASSKDLDAAQGRRSLFPLFQVGFGRAGAELGALGTPIPTSLLLVFVNGWT